MAVQEISRMPICTCGECTKLTVTHNGLYVVKCPSCGTTSEEQDTVNNAVGSFFTKIYKTPLACFIGCLAHELKQFSNDEVIMKVLDAANNADYTAVSCLIKNELDKLNNK